MESSVKNRNLGFVAVLSLVLAMTPSAAFSEYGCGFGKSTQYASNEGKWVYNPDEDNYTLPDGSVVDDVSDLVDNTGSCQKTTWIEDYSNDGFGGVYSLSMGSDEEGPGATSYETIQIFCSKKKLSVYIWVDYPITRGWSGTGQVKFDSGKAKSVAYKVNNTFDGLYLTSPKAFTKSLLNSKKQAIFKINTLKGSKVLAYPKADISKYATKLKKLGCPIK